MIRKMILNWAMKRLWRAVTLKDLENAYQKLDPSTKQRFKVQAKAMMEMELYEWLQEEMLRASSKIHYVRGKSEMDYIASKMCVWLEDIRNKKVYNIANYK